MERYMGWRPGDPRRRVRGMYGYLTTLGAGSAHGGPFVYRSADTDMLGWVCERAAGTRMADLISRVDLAADGRGVRRRDHLRRRRFGHPRRRHVGPGTGHGPVRTTASRRRRCQRYRSIVPKQWLTQARTSTRTSERRSRPRLGAIPHRWLVPQPVLVRPRTAGRSPAVPGHPRPDGAGRPGDAHGLGEAVSSWPSAQNPAVPDRHHPGVRRGRASSGRA